MTDGANQEVVLDVKDLPVSAFGARSLLWWGTFGFMLIEGTGFVLAAAAYFYLRGQTSTWPTAGHRPPDHLWGALFTLLVIASGAPNVWLAAKAKQKNASAVRWGLLAMTLIGVALLVVRGYEFAHLNVRWDNDAYGSAIWLLIFLHTTHLVTDIGDSVVLDWWLFTHQIDDDQFSDVNDNAGYWNFVILTWLPLYLLIYWGPRFL